jgi:Fe-S cluster assembly protein SufB
MAQPDILNLDQDYTQKYGFHDDIQPVFQTERGLTRRVVEEISHQKNEPKWMREFRLQAYEIFMSKPMPTWGPDLSQLNFDEIVYYIQPTDRKGAAGTKCLKRSSAPSTGWASPSGSASSWRV